MFLVSIVFSRTQPYSIAVVDDDIIYNLIVGDPEDALFVEAADTEPDASFIVGKGCPPLFRVHDCIVADYIMGCLSHFYAASSAIIPRAYHIFAQHDP
jgi:hypothetical protein